jgi:hypothetical protein
MFEGMLPDQNHTVGDPVPLALAESLCVPSVSAGNLATSPVPGTVSLALAEGALKYSSKGGKPHHGMQD